jgi:hypothetical protein
MKGKRREGLTDAVVRFVELISLLGGRSLAALPVHGPSCGQTRNEPLCIRQHDRRNYKKMDEKRLIKDTYLHFSVHSFVALS